MSNTIIVLMGLRLYDKIDLKRFGEQENTTTVRLQLKHVAYIKHKYKSIKNFILQHIDEEELAVFLKERGEGNGHIPE